MTTNGLGSRQTTREVASASSPNVGDDLLHDAREMKNAGTITADVCVIGAGPAGMTVASELDAAGVSTVVLEAGGHPYDRAKLNNLPKAVLDHMRGAQSLTRGSSTGEPYFPLRMSRARGIGGSANALKSHGLRARPLDPIDFGSRFGRAWPIHYEEYASHLATAATYCEIPDADETGTRHSWDSYSAELGSDRTRDTVAVPFRHGRREAFSGAVAQLRTSANQRYVTSAIVTGFKTDGAERVTSVEVTALRGGSFSVQAEMFVLAAGGIDNPRLLMSEPDLHSLMGASADLVGRYFMEHLHHTPAYIIPSSSDAADELRTFFGPPETQERWLTVNDDIVREQNLRRTAFSAVPVYEESRLPAVRAASGLRLSFPYGPYALRPRSRQALTALMGLPQIVRAAAARLRRDKTRSVFAVVSMSEQAPDPESRISLSRKRDRVGLPLPMLHWRVSDRDFDDAHRSVEILAGELDRLGLGQVVSASDGSHRRPPLVRGGWHHMGTTRMSSDPSAGVVDENSRVHGVKNLFVVGSSVFPTSGYANPTLSLVALAVRLGRHLAKTAT